MTNALVFFLAVSAIPVPTKIVSLLQQSTVPKTIHNKVAGSSSIVTSVPDKNIEAN
jgi:hypothetical protein